MHAEQLALPVQSRWRWRKGQAEFLLALAAILPLGLFVLYPLWTILRQSVLLPDGGWTLGYYSRYIQDPHFLTTLFNTLNVSFWATLATTLIAFAYAYGLRRVHVPGKAFWHAVMLLPLFAPSLIQALGVQFLLGRNGVVNRYLGTDIEIYGFWGILLSNILYGLPHAYLVLSVSLGSADARLYDAAKLLGAGSFKRFISVTLPAARYGILSALFLGFAINISEFGNPMVLGGDYNVLATEIYNQVAGQANFHLGAVIGVLLLFPVLLSVAAEKWIGRHQAATSSQATPYRPLPDWRAGGPTLLFLGLVAAAILAVVGVVVVASFTRLWPYNLNFSLRHYTQDMPGGYAALWISLKMSLAAAAIGVVVATFSAMVVHKISSRLRQVLYLLSVVPAAVPGMVLGMGYVLAFNNPSMPVYWLYGTVAMLSVCTVYHYHAQAFLIATTGLKQIDNKLQEASSLLGGGVLHTARHVTLPLIRPAMLNIGMFYFMHSMVTISALIFLVSPGVTPAAVSILLLNDAGNWPQAAAFAVIIMLTIGVVVLGAKALAWGAGVLHQRKTTLAMQAL
ncbi:Ferric iron ABC transporter, permease protein [hydrothermal vent metagenome]|uniref:Ferric iron ABC transporter, permease protein n=1 Tax=hydrothermal vent metagenome TaxID=652676 RepID=A0A3B1BCI1_9ZZZZ